MNPLIGLENSWTGQVSADSNKLNNQHVDKLSLMKFLAVLQTSFLQLSYRMIPSGIYGHKLSMLNGYIFDDFLFLKFCSI